MFNSNRIEIIKIINKRINHNLKLYVSPIYKGAITLEHEQIKLHFKFTQLLQSKFTLHIMTTKDDLEATYKDENYLTLNVALNRIVSIIKTQQQNGVLQA